MHRLTVPVSGTTGDGSNRAKASNGEKGGTEMSKSVLLAICAMMVISCVHAQDAYQEDVIQTSEGDLTITFIGHGTLMFKLGESVIHIDPWSRVADYDGLPKADLILVTHEHGDHLDTGAIEAVTKDNTTLVLTAACAEQLEGGIVLQNGDTRTIEGVVVEAVPAYNLLHLRPDGSPFHPKGVGNGYVLTFGDTRVYVAGDTENTPEMKGLVDIDVAFLPMNLPYTMDPEMVADAAKAFRPRILYPYHYGETDSSELERLLADEEDIEVRIRQMS